MKKLAVVLGTLPFALGLGIAAVGYLPLASSTRYLLGYFSVPLLWAALATGALFATSDRGPKLKARLVRGFWEFHAWSGIVSALVLQVVFFMGALAIFAHELDAWGGELKPGSFLNHLHYLKPIPFGPELSGAAALALLLVLISGVLVRFRDPVGRWFRFRSPRTLRSWLGDLHQVFGLVGIPFLFLYAWTGAMIVFGWKLLQPLFLQSTGLAAGGSPFRSFEALFYGLHVVTYGGYLLKAAMALLALLMCVVLVTGNLLWIARRDPDQRRFGNRLLAWLTVALSVGLPLGSAALLAANRLALPETTAFGAALGAVALATLCARTRRPVSGGGFLLAGALFLLALGLDWARWGEFPCVELLLFALAGGAIATGLWLLCRTSSPLASSNIG